MIRSGNLLLVEDNKDDVELTLRAFAKTEFARKIAVARDGEEALEYLFATGPYVGRDPTILPAVVLLDLKLPKVDGLEVLRRIRASPRVRRIPIIILTSSNEEQDLVASYDLGANSFVRKPVDFVDFVQAARLLGLYWLVTNEPPPRSARP